MSKEAMKLNDTGSGYSDEAGIKDVPPWYKRTEVGVIPEDWSINPLQDDIKLFSGHHVLAQHCNVHGEGTPYLTGPADFPDGLIKQTKFTTKPTTLCKPKDILVTVKGSGSGTLVEADAEYCISRQLMAIRTNMWDTKFLLYSLLQNSSRIKAASTGLIPGLSRSDILDQLIPLPKIIAEQRAIAKALSDVDNLLGALDSLIAKKQAIKQGAMQQLLTGKTRLPGFSGEWRSVILGEHVTFLNTGTNSRAELEPEGGVKYLHYGDIHTSNEVYLDPQVTMMPCLSEERARTLARLHNGDLVLVDASEDLVGVGKSFEIQNIKGFDMVAGLHTIVARFDKAVLADGFKAYLQYCPAFRDQLKRLAAGTKVFATNRSHISNVEIQLPDTKEQTAIATVLSDMDAEITALEQRRDKTQQIKQGMMQQLLTGRIRLVKPKEAA